MLKERREAVENVTAAFLDMERTAEESLILGAGCVLTMLEQRRKAKLPIETGADALALVGQGVAHSAAAFASYAKAHPGLTATRVRMDEGDGGDGGAFGPTPTASNVPFGDRPDLRVVKAA